MELNFVTNGGNEFKMEVAYFDSVLEIKEKILKYRKIPISDQTLIFKEEVLADDLNVQNSDIVDQSRIRLVLANPVVTEVIVESGSSSQLHPDPATEIVIVLKLPASEPSELRVDVNDTILQLKCQISLKIEEMQTTPVSRIVIKNQNGMELADDRTLHECQISASSSEVTVELRPKMELLLKMHNSMLTPVLMYGEETIQQLKEKINEMEAAAIDGIVIKDGENGNELPDNKSLLQCAITTHSQLTVEFRPTKKRRVDRRR